MLEKPEIKDEIIISCLQKEFELSVDRISFLPLGADQNTAVYRATTGNKTNYFVKLRRGDFNHATVVVPQYLCDMGIKQIIPVIKNRSGKLWTNLEPFKLFLYPFIEGQNGYERKLSPKQWMEFGKTLRTFHSAHIPIEITNGIKRETFSKKWNTSVKNYLFRIEKETFSEPTAIELAAFLIDNSSNTLELVKRAEYCAEILQGQSLEYIVCHADIHGWNLLIDENGTLYIVDWDTLIYAPKERDLMFIGSGLGDSGYSPREEEALFYKGYGQTEINHIAIAYYRYERIIEDIALYCDQIFLSNEGGEDRNQALINVKSNYLANGTIERAFQSEKMI